MWLAYKKGFKAYLQLEKSLSSNSVEAYLHDIEKLTAFLEISGSKIGPHEITLQLLEQFIEWISKLGMVPGSQARIISGLRSFFKYCLLEQIITIDPAALLEAPKLKRALPDILSFNEIETIIQQIDLSKPEEERTHRSHRIEIGKLHRVVSVPPRHARETQEDQIALDGSRTRSIDPGIEISRRRGEDAQRALSHRRVLREDRAAILVGQRAHAGRVADACAESE